MSATTIALLGAIAGVTIFLGLPIGRLRSPSLGMRSMLNAITIGVLVFLLWDVLTHAVEPAFVALAAATAAGESSWLPFAGLAATIVVGLPAGLLSLVAYDHWVARRVRAARAMAVTLGAESDVPASGGILRLHETPSRLAFLIAVGIGLHNFSEGLAIGQSAAGGQLGLALVLVVGFALHNGTEGFGITAPLAGDERRPTWRQLGLLGAIGGGPTVVGTLLGQVFVNEVVSVAFLALAAGSILYVIVQLIGVAIKLARPYALYIGMLIGILAGFATDFIITAAGA
jgi:ZIP family zinc transporter